MALRGRSTCLRLAELHNQISGRWTSQRKLARLRTVSPNVVSVPATFWPGCGTRLGTLNEVVPVIGFTSLRHNACSV